LAINNIHRDRKQFFDRPFDSGMPKNIGRQFGSRAIMNSLSLSLSPSGLAARASRPRSSQSAFFARRR